MMQNWEDLSLADFYAVRNPDYDSLLKKFSEWMGWLESSGYNLFQKEALRVIEWVKLPNLYLLQHTS